MKKNAVETILGAVVLVTAIVFLVFALNTAQVRAVEGYKVTAAFFKVGGLTNGSDVRINGIKVGTVNDLSIDAGTFDAVVSMSVRSDVKIPADSVAAIGSAGIIGSKFISIQPGGAKEYLADGGKIARTKDFKSLEDQVGEIIFLATGGGG
ncbi:MAG: outer membrane lipid asymmetry maintenance protein MlaD [Rhodospirillales bacterium]|nr:outer membrane lipid asymmetry maintenance protein MlaD [Rhodospirillales bacterium]